MNNKKKKTICFIRSTSIINDSRATKEITSLIDNGFNIIVIGWDRDRRITNYSNVKINGINVKSIFFKVQAKYGKSLSTIKGLLLFQIWLKKQLESNVYNIDYIHACDFDCGYIAHKIAKKYDKKLVYDMYDYYTDSRPMPKIVSGIVEKMENAVINNADISIICGEWRKEQIKLATPKKLIIIHNTPDLNYMSTKNIIKSKSKKIKVAYVGIFQGSRLLLEILNGFMKNKNYELHIGGFGIYEKEIKEASERFDNIFYYGSLKYDEVLSLESNCDLLFATYDPKIKNHKYSAPNKVYEAMALGKPIIVCKNTGIDKLVRDNRIGATINYDANEFFAVLNKYRRNRKELSKNSLESKKAYEEKYSWKIMEKVLIESYNGLE